MMRSTLFLLLGLLACSSAFLIPLPPCTAGTCPLAGDPGASLQNVFDGSASTSVDIEWLRVDMQAPVSYLHALVFANPPGNQQGIPGGLTSDYKFLAGGTEYSGKTAILAASNLTECTVAFQGPSPVSEVYYMDCMGAGPSRYLYIVKDSPAPPAAFLEIEMGLVA